MSNTNTAVAAESGALERVVVAAAADMPGAVGVNPLAEPVDVIVARLVGAPGVWHLIGTGLRDDRARYNNSASLFNRGKYMACRPYVGEGVGRFVARVSAALDAPHADKYELAVYARYLPADWSEDQ